MENCKARPKRHSFTRLKSIRLDCIYLGQKVNPYAVNLAHHALKGVFLQFGKPLVSCGSLITSSWLIVVARVTMTGKFYTIILTTCAMTVTLVEKGSCP